MTRKPRSFDEVGFRQFARLIERNLGFASYHFGLHWGLVNSVSRFAREFNETRTFWGLTIQSHLDVALLGLGRVFDQQNGTASIEKWLVRIDLSPDLFAKSSVSGRGWNWRQLDSEQLQRDIEAVAQGRPVVRSLIQVRNKRVAHTPLSHANELSKEPQLKYGEVDQLIKEAFVILNRYTALFDGNAYAAEMVGADDYLRLLGLVRKGIDASLAEHN